MRRVTLIANLVGVVAFVGCAVGRSSTFPAGPGPGSTGSATHGSGRPGSDEDGKRRVLGRPALITRAIDGDTVEARWSGRVVDVRLIGIDTPETVAPGQSVECYGPQASRFTERRLEGERVHLELDVQHIDPYDRLLAYVWIGDQLFNRTLVARGFAVVSTYPPNVQYLERFRAAQRHARLDDAGLWGACPSA